MCLQLNRKAHVACNFNCIFGDEGLLKVTGSHVGLHHKYGNTSERCKMESLLLQNTNRKWYMAYLIAVIRKNSDDPKWPSRLFTYCCLFKWDFLIELCSSWHFHWHIVSRGDRGPTAIAKLRLLCRPRKGCMELLVCVTVCVCRPKWIPTRPCEVY